MQILGSILPGFRDVRAPLVAGYIWLTLAWVLASPDLDTRPTDGVLGSVYDLGQEVGIVGVAIAVSVGAYLVGSVSQVVTEAAVRDQRVSRRVLRLRDAVARRLGLREIGSEPPVTLEKIDRAYARGLQAIEDLGQGVTGEALARLRTISLNELDERMRVARLEATRELGRPATLLVGDQPQLFAEVDRLRAEGDLRLAVFFPLMALSIALGVMQSPWWLLVLLPLLIVLADGLAKIKQSRQVISDAIALGKVPSPSQADFETWVARFADSELPARRVRAGSGLEIIKAVWGTDEEHEIDVTERLRSLISDGRLVLRAENDNLGGDPQYGVVKTLQVEYTTGGIVERATFDEHDNVGLPAAQEQSARAFVP